LKVENEYEYMPLITTYNNFFWRVIETLYLEIKTSQCYYW